MNSPRSLRIAFALSLLAFAATVPFALAEQPQGYTLPLFNGKNLHGWHVVGDCKAGVEQGSLVLLEGDGFLRTDHQYRDFILELEWKPRETESWDSGIYFRAALPPQDAKWPRKYQLNLRAGQEGNLIGVEGARSEGLVKAGDWNHFRLTVVGKRAELKINGKQAWSAGGIEEPAGYVGLQLEVPQGGQFEFRDITLTELGYRSLFAGEDFTHWEGAGRDASSSWKVEDGLLVCTGKRGTWLRSKETFGDFNLRLQYKLRPGGNSGVYCRVPPSGKHHGKDAGVEVQILDDRAERYRKLKPYQFAGSVYAIAPSTRHVGRPAGEWNSLEINAKGHDYRVIHNGTLIVDAPAEKFRKLEERLLEGHLGLQNHSEEVWFRHLRIGPAF